MPPAYGLARAAMRYDDIARVLVQRFKYSDRLDLAPMMVATIYSDGDAGRHDF